MANNPMHKPGETSRAFFYYLVATAVVCGAFVMIIEIVGSRIIGPFYGASLFVWTSLISVTLIALAAGYAVGGLLSDRKASAATLYIIILAAGVLLLLTPLLKAPLLKATLAWGLRMGSFASSLALFGPPLFLLGCVSPYLVKLAARELQTIGRTVGVLYAFSTFGSFVGAVMTGFFLISFFSVNAIFTAIGALLISLSGIFFFIFRSNILFLAALALPFFLHASGKPVEKKLENGAVLKTLESKDTFYGTIKVLDYSEGGARYRGLLIDGSVQGGIDVVNDLSIYEYSYFMTALPYGTNPEGKTCLVLGLGAGVVPRWFEAQGIATDVVEINPTVVQIARDYFGFSSKGSIFAEDARYYLGRSAKKYDYVIIDVFSGDTTPGHLLSREALELVRNRLTEQGIVAINLIGSLRQETLMTASVVRTVKETFSQVILYPNFDPNEGDGFGNITILASNTSLPAFNRAKLPHIPLHPLIAESVQRNIGRTFAFRPGTPAIVLTDGYNPIDFYDSWLKERLRRMILQGNDPDFLT